MFALIKTYVWSLMVPSAVLLPVYAVTFYKVWVGTRYKLVLVLNTLLFVANVGYLIQGIG